MAPFDPVVFNTTASIEHYAVQPDPLTGRIPISTLDSDWAEPGLTHYFRDLDQVDFRIGYSCGWEGGSNRRVPHNHTENVFLHWFLGILTHKALGSGLRQDRGSWNKIWELLENARA